MIRIPLASFDAYELDGGYAVVSKGDMTLRVQVEGMDALLFPERSVKHRDLAKRF
jgi:hypothetical protein